MLKWKLYKGRVLTLEEEHRIREEEKFDAEIRNKLKLRSIYGFAWLPGSGTLISAIVIAAILLTGIATLAI